MRKFKLLAGGLLLLSINTALAQKPNPTSPLEIKLPAENESWRIEGNQRVLTRTGYPQSIYNVGYRTLANSPEAQAREYLTNNRAKLGLTNNDIDNLHLHAIRTDDAGTVVRLRQTWRGLPVNKNAEITVHISPAGMVDFLMNGFQYGVRLADATPSITATTARQRVTSHLSVGTNISFEKQELMVLHYQGTDRLVYMITIETDSPVGEWESFVDANTGSLVKVEDMAAYHHKKTEKKPYPIRTTRVLVNGTGNVFDPDPLSTAAAAYGGSYVDNSDANAAVLTAQLKSVTLLDITFSGGVYSLVGPYASIVDFEAPSNGLFTQASSTFAFDRNADAFEAVNCYYHIDAAMRYLNTTLGLTIHPYHYSGGVRYDPSGLSGADNSYYLGASGRLSFGEGGVDDAEDADVIIHELGHGIHDWVTLGGLSQVNGLSEGSGDYWCASYSRAKNNWLPAQAAYNWTFNWDGHNPFWAGRITNYAPIYPGGLTGTIHTDGQIWATAMMKIWNDIGRLKADKAFWAGLALTNSTTNQNDAANAVFTAATTMNYTNAERFAMHSRFTAAGYTLPAFVALPVKLTVFDAAKAGKQTIVSWHTEGEYNMQSYIVERSLDGSSFNKIGTVQPTATLSTNGNYEFIDPLPVGGNDYYRLRAVNSDGSFVYSKIVNVIFDKSNQLVLQPNPAAERFTIRDVVGNATVQVYDNTGKEVLRRQFSNNTGAVTIELNNLPSGTYIVKVIQEGNTRQGTLLKQ